MCECTGTAWSTQAIYILQNTSYLNILNNFNNMGDFVKINQHFFFKYCKIYTPDIKLGGKKAMIAKLSALM